MVKILRFAAKIQFLSGLLTLPPSVATRPRHAERCAAFAAGLGTGCRPGEREGTLGGSLLLHSARRPGCKVLLEFTVTRNTFDHPRYCSKSQSNHVRGSRHSTLPTDICSLQPSRSTMPTAPRLRPAGLHPPCQQPWVVAWRRWAQHPWPQHLWVGCKWASQ